MRYRILSVGKIRESYIAAAVDDFAGRLRHYGQLDETEVPASTGSDPIRALPDEAERIARFVVPGDTVWLLERSGTMLASVELSEKLQALEREGRSRVTFIVAGTFGAAPALVERADFLWSLGPLTFLHEWARAIVLEQLYRAAKIARNEPYHH